MRRLLPYIVTFALGWLAGTCLGAPRDEVRAAVGYTANVVPQSQWTVSRYMSLANVADEHRTETVAVVNHILNSLGRASTIQQVTVAGDVCHVDLAAFGIDALAWEALGQDDRYFHAPILFADPKTGKPTKGVANGLWIEPERMAQLKLMLGTEYGIVRADWFVAKAFLPPHYYNLAGIPKKLGDFYAMLGLDAKQQLELQAHKGASIFDSGVTRKPRRVSRWQGARIAWVTYDSREDGDILKHPLRVPGFAFKHDASEHIATKANGLHLYALYDANGNRQDEVPPDIAHDASAGLGNDQRLRAGMSCIRCHTDGGLKSFDNDFAKMLGPGKADLHLPADEAAYIAAFNDVERTLKLLERDREDFELAVKRATGLASKDLSKAFAAVYARYEYDRIDVATMKRDLGADSLEPLKTSTDPIVLAVLSGIPVTRKDWETSYGSAATIMGASK